MQINLNRTNQMQAMHSQNKHQTKQNAAFGAISVYELAKNEKFETVFMPSLREQAIVGKTAQLLNKVNQHITDIIKDSVSEKLKMLAKDYSTILKSVGFSNSVVINDAGRLSITKHENAVIPPAADIIIENHEICQPYINHSSQKRTLRVDEYKGASIIFPELNINLHDILLSDARIGEKISYDKRMSHVKHFVMSGKTGEETEHLFLYHSGNQFKKVDENFVSIKKNIKANDFLQNLANMQRDLDEKTSISIRYLKSAAQQKRIQEEMLAKQEAEVLESSKDGQALENIMRTIAVKK